MNDRTTVRQDRVWWVDENHSTLVNYRDKDGEYHNGVQRDELLIWAPVSGNTLYVTLTAVIDDTAPKILANALRAWQYNDDPDRAIAELDATEEDLDILLSYDWSALAPNHHYKYNGRGPSATRYVTTRPQELRTKTKLLQTFEHAVLEVAYTYGGPSGHLVEAELEYIPEWVDCVKEEMRFLRELAQAHGDPTVVIDTLPDKYKGTCEECGKLLAKIRKDVRYHSNACRQRAYRKRGGVA